VNHVGFRASRKKVKSKKAKVKTVEIGLFIEDWRFTICELVPEGAKENQKLKVKNQN